jgi:hypothetical protein
MISRTIVYQSYAYFIPAPAGTVNPDIHTEFVGFVSFKRETIGQD